MKNKHKKNGFIKGVFIGAMATSFMLTGGLVSAEEIRTQETSDGFVKIEGELGRESDKSQVTLLVTNSNIDFTDESAWLDMSGKEIAYYSEAILGSDKTYSFKFKIETPGVYNVYLASENGGIEKSQLVYFDTKMNASLIEVMLEIDNADDLKEITGENLANLGVFAFKALDFDDKAAEILLSALENEESLKSEEMTLLIEKSILLSKINNGDLKSFYDYKDMSLMDDKIFSYCSEEIAEDVVSNMEKSKISDVSEFDEALMKATIVEIANTKDGILLLKEALGEYKDELSISKKITTDLCESLIKASDFSDYEDLEEAINDYREESGNSGGGGSSGGSGSKGNKNNVSINSISNILPTGENKKEEVLEITPFDDIDGVEWAKEAILRLYKDKVINGKTENTFCPYDNVTRAEFVKILMLAFDVKLIDDECPFTDVSENEWSYPYIKTAYLAGAVNGVDSVTFGKNLNITREDLCTMVYRLMVTGNPEYKNANSELQFKDKEQISGYAKEAVGFMQEKAIINGDESGNFNPKAPATRAEAVKIVYNAMNLYEREQ